MFDHAKTWLVLVGNVCVVVWHIGARSWNNVRVDGSHGGDSCSGGNLGLGARL